MLDPPFEHQTSVSNEDIVKRNYTPPAFFSAGQQICSAIQRSPHPPCLSENPHMDSLGPTGIAGLLFEGKTLVLEVGGLCENVWIISQTQTNYPLSQKWQLVIFNSCSAADTMRKNTCNLTSICMCPYLVFWYLSSLNTPTSLTLKRHFPLSFCILWYKDS